MITNIGELFEIEYGQKEYHNKENLEDKNGGKILISAKGEDNGIYGFYDIENNYKAPIISVPSTGSIGQAFIQMLDCSIDDNCLVLIPKEKLDIETLFQVAFQIRNNKWRYRYGRQITPDKLAKQKVKIEKIKTNFKDLSKSLLPKERIKEKIQQRQNTKFFKVRDLCEIEKKIATPQSDINLEGNTPYVSSSSQDNGVVLFTDEKPNAKAGSLTIAKDGNDGYSFYQPIDYITSLHNYILTTKNSLPKFLLLYVGAIVRMKSSRYNHYYPLSKRHLERMEIPIPLKDGKMDLDYIKKIVENSFGFEELKKYL